MALINRKISTYAKDVSNLSNTPNDDGITAAELKAVFMGAAKEEIKTSVNGIVDDLVATTDGASGADQIGATALKVGGATTVQGQLEEVKVDSTLALSGHTSNSSNPHSVNKAQVGLGNVDNTSDADKPVSTAQATADALAVHKAGTETITGTKGFTTSPTVPTPTADTQAAPKKYVDDSVSELDTAITNDLNTAVDTLEYAILDVDTAAVHKAVNETITGIKTFSVSPTVPIPTTDTQAAPKKYVDDHLSAQNVGTLINGATAKTTPIDADMIGVMDSAASNVLKKLSWANVKTALANVFTSKSDYTRINSIWQDTGTANNIVITPSPAISDIADGMRFAVQMNHTNTSEIVMITINGIGPYLVFKTGSGESPGRTLIAGELGEHAIYDFIYSGNDTFRVMIPDDKSKVDVSSIVNDLTTGGTGRPLSAEQGKIAASIPDVAASKTYTRSLKVENDHLVLTLSEIV